MSNSAITSGFYTENNVKQIVHSTICNLASTTTTIPYDNTKPQNTEGKEWVSATITPISSTSTLIIEVFASFIIGSSATHTMTGAIFQDSGADALQSASTSNNSTGSYQPFYMKYYKTSGSTATTTFKFRAGASAAGTLYGVSFASGKYLGVGEISMVIREYE